MSNCTADLMTFGQLKHWKIEANFQGGAISSDGGFLLVRQLNRPLGLTKSTR